MKMYLDCIHCFVRQSLDAVRLFTDDEEIHEQVLRTVLREAGTMDFHASPPVIAQRIHRMIRGLIGDDDPYRSIKDRCNTLEFLAKSAVHQKSVRFLNTYAGSSLDNLSY